MSRPNPALAAKNREMEDFVRDTINGVVAHHFPDATPHHLGETAYATGMDEKPVAGKSSARTFRPVDGHEDMWPGFVHSSHNLPENKLKGNDGAEAGLRRDLNRLFTGNPDGQQIPVVVAKDADGKVTSRSTRDMVAVSASSQHPEGAVNVIAYGSPAELYDRIQANLAGNADLQQYAPKGSRQPGK